MAKPKKRVKERRILPKPGRMKRRFERTFSEIKDEWDELKRPI